MKFNVFVSIGVLLVASTAAFCADGAAMYNTKCAGCHGANGQGKPAMKAPALKETKLDVNQIVAHLMKGEPASKAPHNRGIPGLKEDDAKAIAEYVKTLK